MGVLKFHFTWTYPSRVAVLRDSITSLIDANCHTAGPILQRTGMTDGMLSSLNLHWLLLDMRVVSISHGQAGSIGQMGFVSLSPHLFSSCYWVFTKSIHILADGYFNVKQQVELKSIFLRQSSALLLIFLVWTSGKYIVFLTQIPL